MTAAAAIARVIRAPGRIVISPVDLGDDFPYGGTLIGKSHSCVVQPLGENYNVDYESLGRPGEVLKGSNRHVFACFLRGWDDAAVNLLMAGTAGAITQHSTFSGPGPKTPGNTALGRAFAVLYVPDDTINVPAVLLYRAVPYWTSGAHLAFQRGSELGLPITFECVRDATARILAIGRIEDLTL